MPHGVPTPDDVEVIFRTHYLRTGNIRASARQAKIPERTGQDLATRANADQEFAQARAAMYARALPDAERMLIGGLEVASDRLEAGPELTANDLAGSGAQKITIQDPGPAYLRAIADGVKVLTVIRKNAEPDKDAAPVEVHVHLKPEPSDDDGSA
jgi:phage terminase small subunit